MIRSSMITSEVTPMYGQQNTLAHLPLAGIRVLEFASMLSGPFAGMLLRLLGAEVIKVERTGGDPFRGYGGFSSHFANFNAGKKSVVVDLNDARGREAALKLIETADVLLENSRPGQMEKLGLSEHDCRLLNPRLVYVGISGFGLTGPLADRPAYDAIGQAMSGLMDALTTDAAPSVGPALGDVVSGLVGVSAVLAGLAGRGVSGTGSTVQTSMIEALGCVISDALLHYTAHGSERTRADRSTRSQVFSLKCADGKYVMIQLSGSQKFFANLLRLVGKSELLSDDRFATYAARMENQPAMQEILQVIFSDKGSVEWEELLAAADVPSGPVLSVAEVVAHPQTEALEMFGPVEQDGSRRYRGPWMIDGHRPPTPGPAPLLGQDTQEIFAELFGTSDTEKLVESGVLVAMELNDN
jgi:crotonobetainyl-CoA:carnitine CoA-transferase CaiB-like acyl-CoA transferase